jgi:hypothetical protein
MVSYYPYGGRKFERLTPHQASNMVLAHLDDFLMLSDADLKETKNIATDVLYKAPVRFYIGIA